MKLNKLLNDAQSGPNQPDANGQNLAQLEKKVAELIDAIEQADIDTQHSRHYQKQIADAFQRSASTQKRIAPFKELDQDNNLSREELLEGLEKLLAENQIDSRMNAPKRSGKLVQKGVMFILALLLIVVGFAMIIMPAPPSFELFTVYYFNINDGVTIMDLVSLLIIFGGVLLFVLNFNKK
ncbi:hypothetical protein GCM10010967_19550 [Dyadobacter beijingensis]|uniref:EF-hand domain-containing protein n=1 Tax=Dyadobacter beijingensis TaxID=365489 RepID=A0ABQ2HNP5_9BACT|nr:hypothetical protein [Dyadobacter beijingensis]GGM87242.1 hypothetical protein GCM10010967_19550 [Dyadobacter beijingensis]